ncbi:MAG TPA: bifunctional 2-polyprenyl-6-hydroxyphenol methylase/3-demethylubiquinol 3-O-methyltransferase UbiG [Ktedonobacteraceae bacterium]|nr:bifunctional 2-polyprenyl-6-hydroxyphenol methylase/3-demethylubiquinol 3-O-methyltransferase UbiG [Ktedonobacteraceae bacterium]
MLKRKRSQEEIFSSFGWWDKGCFLNQMTGDRCDYIESCITKVFGNKSLAQQQILEVGCGGGLICEELARRGVEMVGIDPSQGALDTATSHAQERGLGESIYYQQAYAESLPFADGSFSAIVCFDVLEHVRDLKATIKEIARVLAPGGVFVFDTINRTFLARAILIWYGENFPSGGLQPGIHNYHAFIKPQELHNVISANGLNVNELRGFMPRGFTNGHVKMGPGWFKGVAYVGYATKAHESI